MAYEKICGTCNTPFIASDFRRLYCDRCRTLGQGRNRTRTQARKEHTLSFVGVDGEGVDRPDGRHEYIMLSVGKRTLWKDGTVLHLRDILSFLWECYQEQPDAVFVGFFLGYDFAQWFRQLPEREARLLFTDVGMAARKSQRTSRANPLPDPVVYGGWEIDLMAGRRFRMRPHRHRKSQFADVCANRTCAVEMEVLPTQPGADQLSAHQQRGLPDVKGRGWFYLCDTGSFWQTSFLNVVKPENWHGTPVCTTEEYALLKRGKDDRGHVFDYGSASYFQSMRNYNTLENDILGRVTTRLNQGFANEQIPIHLKKHEWFGPGRAAQAWMDMLHKRIADPMAVQFNRKKEVTTPRANEKGILSADIYMSLPSWFAEAAQASYYGGWFEISVHGHAGHLWEYDINSAYPHVISSLPCLHTDGGHTGQYHRGSGDDFPVGDGYYTLVYGTFRGSDPYLGVLPYRTKVGSVLRPHAVKGWYWAHEIMASKNAGLIDHMDIHEWVSLRSCRCPSPFNLDRIGIGRMYDLRLKMGKNTPAGKAFKLVYNSAYGKTAQSVGSPKYASSVYASLITAGTRTYILDAIASHPARSAGVAMVATDGVYFTSRHPSLPLSPTQLGAWDETFRKNMTLLMPGVYWDDTTREMIAAGEAPKLKSRGVAARDLAMQIDRLDYEFAIMHGEVAAGNPVEWPTIEFPVRFAMTSPKLALHRGTWNTAGSVQHGDTRKLSANPASKRRTVPYFDDNTVRTHVYPEWSTLNTTPYARRFGLHDDDELISRDGDGIYDSFQRLLHP